MGIAQRLEGLFRRLEQAEVLDTPANALASIEDRALPSGRLRDVLSGVPLGHPLHPALVGLPIGAWASALPLDLAGQPEAARRLVGLGCAAAVPAMMAGASDWLYTTGPERRVGFVHAGASSMALLMAAASWRARRAGRYRAGVGWSLLGNASVALAGWLGGHLAYAQGVGVDTTVFEGLPSEWTDIGAASDLPGDGELARFDAGGVPLLVSRVGGRAVAMADRCTHRGAPLHDGEVVDGCVRCPWHGSQFALADGAVRSGPASRPQPSLEVRIHGDRVEVRHEHARDLQANPVGP